MSIPAYILIGLGFLFLGILGIILAFVCGKVFRDEMQEKEVLPSLFGILSAAIPTIIGIISLYIGISLLGGI